VTLEWNGQESRYGGLGLHPFCEIYHNFHVTFIATSTPMHPDLSEAVIRFPPPSLTEPSSSLQGQRFCTRVDGKRTSPQIQKTGSETDCAISHAVMRMSSSPSHPNSSRGGSPSWSTFLSSWTSARVSKPISPRR
jgi:hypothetical protein